MISPWFGSAFSVPDWDGVLFRDMAPSIGPRTCLVHITKVSGTTEES